ncbi:IS66 family transposase [Oligoflexus sp.]|uniref:IS66 family transposase n=1 Tax=Oligoflexus sp. TaxID=1971216 RepID=UPI0039C8D09B
MSESASLDRDNLEFRLEGRPELNTNPVENSIRPFALGMKAWLCSDTVKEANAGAALYSLDITARANGIEPMNTSPIS